MIHIGHDTVIGKNCLIAAQVGIAGVADIGEWSNIMGTGRSKQNPYNW